VRRSKPVCGVAWCVAERAKGLKVCAVHKGHHYIPDELSTAQKIACPVCRGFWNRYQVDSVCSTCSGSGRVLDVQHALRRAA
jgi:RecJ-like exonuclease